MLRKKIAPTALFFATLLASMFMAGCQDRDIYKNFETEYEFIIRIPPNTGFQIPVDLFSSEQESNASVQYEINDTRKDLVEEVYLTSLKAEIVEPANQNFDFLSRVEIVIDAEGERQIKIAEKDPVQDGLGNLMYFDVFTANLAPYIKKEPFEIGSTVVVDENYAETIEIRLTAKFDVKAKVLDL